jgi:murein DD-endopeptidase MepM/ murein hydrolase activator NlpD
MIKYRLILFLFLFPIILFSQNRDELEKERLRIISKIEFTSDILKKTESDKFYTLDYLKSLQNQISNRKMIIDNLKNQIDQINNEIIEYQNEYDSLIFDKSKLINSYNNSLRLSYIQSSTKNKFLFLISSSDWENFLDRNRYLKQFSNYTKIKISEIKTKQERIGFILEKIKTNRSNLEELISKEKENLDKLNKETKKKNDILRSLRKNERKLLAVLKKQKKEREKLNRNIEDIIISSLKGNTGKTGSELDVTIKFERSKNKLDMPVSGGYISSHFGKHKHPSIKGVYVFNNGIDIRTTPYANIKAVFDGEVAGLMHITGYNWMLLLKHGDYYTVYSKLESVDISKGDKVKKGQKLGKIGENGQFHFEVWKKKNKLNPEKWLKKI